MERKREKGGGGLSNTSEFKIIRGKTVIYSFFNLNIEKVKFQGSESGFLWNTSYDEIPRECKFESKIMQFNNFLSISSPNTPFL